ncbi:hypothetical protein J2Z62_000658 [Mycoplasmoides fastidiosum]|uniref:Uncharacterized protein n=1 Tax=Mycoplasmoides fastidiosum TaxID=92758 RepID=A0ABU0LZT6_9BACT|nr:hypothetical protein [Mycoplasmoides fastidiosum]MDQ0514220.1 hypothetical protein [Mycoplasmoides fastidiosum]UUD37372.1 hypothetical protein NPA10_02190 [Mycoplasmoides fastidiosum]
MIKHRFSDQTIEIFKLKEIVPFYISDINVKFFDSLNNHPNKTFIQKVLPAIKKNLKAEDLEELDALDNLTKAEKIKLMLNLALQKIMARTSGSSDGLLKLQPESTKTNPVYIGYMHKYHPQEIDGAVYSQIERRYNFFIDINQSSYLNKYIEQIQLSFYLDEDNEILSGGFSLNYDWDQLISFDASVQKIYLRTLIRNFILKQLYPMSLENLLELFGTFDSHRKPTARTTKTDKLKFTDITVDDIKNNWVEIINKKFLNYLDLDQVAKQYFQDTLFYSIVITVIIILSLYEELRIYFTNESPEIILGILNRPTNINRQQQDPVQDYNELSHFLSENYFSKKKDLKIEKVRSAEELIELSTWANAERGFESFGFPLPVFEFHDSQNNLLISADSFFKENDKMKLFYLMTISPQLFGMDEDGYFIEYGQLLRVLAANKFNSKTMPLFYEKVQESNCELNYNFATYLNEKTILILKTEPVDVYHDYFWAQIYAQSINWIRKDIEFDFDNDLNPKKNALLYREKINTLENLIFDWQDEFYGIPQIRHIVYKIDEINNLKSSIRLLIDRINEKDKIFRKDNEIKILIFAFATAAIIGFNNFFGMIYTVLSVGKDASYSTANITVISISAILAFILIFIFGIYIVRVYKNKKFLKRFKKTLN